MPKVIDYFEDTIMPVIRDNHLGILSEMSIMILGSVALGIDDELSDLEAAVYLDDTVWRESGGQLQLTLNDCLSKTNPWKNDGSVISVHPLSWLLDGQAKKFLQSSRNLPWEKVSFETLFTIQNNLIFYDPQDTLNRLRNVTSPSQYPEHLWKKSLIQRFKTLVEDLSELKLSTKRNRIAESYIVLGHIIEGLFQIGFLILHQYYPWRTHLRWAFDKLPLPTSDLGSKIYSLSTCTEWNRMINIIETIIATYQDYINTNSIIPEVNIKCSDKAIESGYESYQFWVWSLWGWVNEELKKDVDGISIKNS